jgi:uncharacterized membrane protein
VDVPRSPLESVLTLLAAAILIASFSVVGWYWPRLPASVPVHFNAAGDIDGYGSKLSLLAFPALFTVFFVVLTVLERVPRVYNYPWRITAENAARQYRLARTLIVTLKLLLTSLCLVVVVAVTSGALHGRATGTDLFPALLAAFGVSIVAYFVAAYRAR